MSVGHAVLVARMELTHRVRKTTDRPTQIVALAVAALFGAIPLLGSIAVAFVVGQGIASGTITDPISTARLAAAVVPLFVTLVVTLRVVQTSGSLTIADGLLTTVSHREAVGGILLSELAIVAVLVGVPSVGVPVAFAVGSGQPAAFPLVFVALVVLSVLGTLLGFVVGLGLRNLVARSEFLARYKTAIGILLFLLYFVGISSQQAGSAIFPVVDALGSSPLGWFADLALFGQGVGADPLSALGAVVVGVVALPVLGWLASWLAALLWYTSPVQPEEEEREPSQMGSLAGVSRPMARIARKSWIRARRGPIRLVYVVYPLFLLFPFVQGAVVSGEVPTALPPLLAFYGAWAAGAAFSLNPIGDEGPVLPVTLTTPVAGSTFVGGLCLAGVAIGVPITLVLAVVTGVLSGLGTLALASVALTAVVLPVAATGIAVGAGVLFPRMESVEVFRGVETTAPSLFAFALYSLVLSISGVPVSLVSTPLTRGIVVDATNYGESVVVAGGLVATVVLAGLAATVGYVFAVRSFDDYYLG
ncbi:hypothetical protein [Halomarina oriensis]|uniref:Uncharacterized protein n=1 Tax=Halomarina oriensis TaxID=671145 RepID=A0A6B0GJS6_9EURY|nr:hypothetical protein [Halomarina oriensis]MWG34111.1 hypothetical protein [Halomarina oriensis]